MNYIRRKTIDTFYLFPINISDHWIFANNLVVETKIIAPVGEFSTRTRVCKYFLSK